MSYVSAESVLPKELLETIQQYINGEFIYIPSKEKKDWGSQTDTKQFLYDRNHEIYDKYKSGSSSKSLATEYALSVKSIQRILRDVKEMEQAAS